MFFHNKLLGNIVRILWCSVLFHIRIKVLKSHATGVVDFTAPKD